MLLQNIRANALGAYDVIVEFTDNNKIEHAQIESIPKGSRWGANAVASSIMTYTAGFGQPVWLDKRTVALSALESDLSRLEDAGLVRTLYQNTLFEVPHAPEIGPAAAVENEDNWAIQGLEIAKFYELGCTGKSVKVGVLDSGIFNDHKVFSSGQLKGYAAFDSFGQLKSDEKPRDSMWHGTHVCGILAGQNDGFSRGVAPEVDLYVGRVLDGWNGSVASIKAGLIWMRDVVRPQVLNLSLGWPGLHAPLCQTSCRL